MKKFISLVLVLIVMLTMVSAVWAKGKDKGEYITEERITQQAVEEIAVWKAEKTGSKLPRGYAEKTSIEGLNFTSIVEAFKFDKTFEGSLEQIEGIQEKEFDLPRGGKMILTFTVTKEITQEAKPEVKMLYYIGYGYEKGCNVYFNKDLEFIDTKMLDKKKPFIPGKSKVWSGRLWNKIYLYTSKDWECPAPSITPTPSETVTPSDTPTSTPTTSDTIAPTSSETVTITPTIINEEEVTAVIVDDPLPKTGESAPISYIILGSVIIAAGLLMFLRYKLQ